MNLLITRPRYDYTTRYISAWAEPVVQSAKSKGHHVLDLQEERANRQEVESMLKKQTPEVVFFNGHGSEDTLTGHNGEVILRTGENEHLLSEKIIYALSCRSAKILGASSVKKGARAYIGYIEDFIFMYSSEKRTRPRVDRTAALFLEPSNQVPLSLIKGNSASRAYRSAKNAYARGIQKLLTSRTSKEDTATIRYLFWDMKNLVCQGDGSARP